jgi:hypothetical protein
LSFLALINLYVLLVSKQWLYFYAFYTLMGFISLLLFYKYVPESPKWLHMQGQTQEALSVLQTIATLNGSDKKINFMQASGGLLVGLRLPMRRLSGVDVQSTT